MSVEKALQIPLILKNVFSNLGKDDLVCCRLAGPKYVWNKEACTILRSQIEVQFHTPADLTKFIDIFESSIPGISLRPSRYFFDMDRLQTGVMIQEQVQKFVKIAGDIVQELCLRLHVGEAAFHVEPMIYIYFPSLNSLSITFHNDSVSSAPKGTLVEPFVGKVANLKKIQLCHEYSHENGNFPGHVFDNFILFISALLRSAEKLQYFMLKANDSWSQFTESLMQAVISNLISCRLNQLTLNAPLSGNNLHSLSTHATHFPLENVRLEKIDTNSVSPPDLKHFLNRYRSSLCKLFIDLFGSQSTEMCFPLGIRMDQLNCLTLGDFFGSLEWNKLPALKTISLFDSSLQGILSPIISSSTCSSLECIDIQWSSDSQEEFISLFTQVAPYLFPQLTSLTIGYDDCIAPLALIFKECRLLKRLALNKCAGVTDDLLCGMDTCSLDVAWPEEYSDSEDDDEIGLVADAYKNIVLQAKANDTLYPRTLPYIGDLNDLQYLTLTFDRYTYSDISVLYGIIRCEKLRELELLSPDISRERSIRVIKQAGLEHLRKARVCYEHVLMCEQY